MIAGRNLSLGSVAALAALSASFGAWSATSGPAVAEVQLSDAAQNLAAATSFVEVADLTEGVIGTADQEQIHEVVDYEAPNRVSVTQTVRVTTAVRHTSSDRTLIQIGSSCWTHLSGSPGSPLACSGKTRQRFLDVLLRLESSSGVTDVSGTYFLSRQDSTTEIQTLAAGQFSIGMPSVEVRMSGDTISWERLSFDAGVTGGSILIDDVINFMDIDHGPAVLQPAGAPTATASG
ncbi:MAG: hypothetical protein ACLP6E_18665 [Acidimicrobiales bacterium]